MDPILADAATGHNDMVADLHPLFMAGFAVELRRHDGRRTTINQRLAGKSIVKLNGTINRRNAAFVAAMFNPFDNTFKNTPWVQQARW